MYSLLSDAKHEEKIKTTLILHRMVDIFVTRTEVNLSMNKSRDTITGLGVTHVVFYSCTLDLLLRTHPNCCHRRCYSTNEYCIIAPLRSITEFVFTVHQRSCGKVMFSVLSVSMSVLGIPYRALALATSLDRDCLQLCPSC